MLNSLISVFVNNVNKGGNCLYDSTKSLLFITFIKWKMSIQQNAKIETWFETAISSLLRKYFLNQ